MPLVTFADDAKNSGVSHIFWFFFFISDLCCKLNPPFEWLYGKHEDDVVYDVPEHIALSCLRILYDNVWKSNDVTADNFNSFVIWVL